VEIHDPAKPVSSIPIHYDESVQPMPYYEAVSRAESGKPKADATVVVLSAFRFFSNVATVQRGGSVAKTVKSGHLFPHPNMGWR
jgi:hypothetical protein